MPEVSVLIPAYNGWPLLEATVRSALAQEDADLEVIVADDQSSDGTPDALEALGDPRIRVLRQAERGGPSRARNAALRAATGDWVAFLDQDDLWAPHKVRSQLRAAHEQRADFVYTAAVRVDSSLRILHVDAPVVDAGKLFPTLLRSNAIAGGASGPLARTELVRSVGGFDPSLRYMEDWDLWVRLALAAPRSAACQEPLVAYRVHPGSMLLTEVPDLDSELAHFTTKHAEALRHHRVTVNGLETYRWLAWTSWIDGRRGAAVRAYSHGLRRHATRADMRFACGQLLRGGVETLTRRAPRQRVAWLEALRS